MNIIEELYKLNRPFIFQLSTDDDFVANLSGGINGDSRQVAIMVLAVIAEMIENNDINAVNIIIAEANNMIENRERNK